MVSRREALLTTAALAGGATITPRRADAELAVSGNKAWESSYSGTKPGPRLAPGQPGRDYQPVITPNGAVLDWRLVDGVKVYHLVAEAVEHELAPGLKAHCWGYNGRVHGPTIEAVEGDRVRM
jgi:FtsP/CotA-like multicopper oxidase with cupredoxin domain